jgi:lipopolysaccharide export system permease protein
MKIIERYLLSSFLRVFFILLGGMGFLIAVVGLVERYPELSEFSPPFYKIGLYLLYTIMSYGSYLILSITLLGIIFVLGQASRHREIMIISASGGKLKEVIRPIIISGIFITIGCGLFTNLISPVAKKFSRELVEDITHESSQKNFLFGKSGAWLRSEEFIVRIGLYEPLGGEARDVSVYFVKDGALVKRIEARRAVLNQEQWELKDVFLYDLENSKVFQLESYTLKGSKYSLRILRAGSSPDEMNSSRLWRYLRALKKSGLKNTKLVADFNLRLSLPITCVAMSLLGIYLGVLRGLSGLVGAGAGVVIGLLFWFGTTFMMSLAYSGVLSPWIAPWIMPLLSLTAGISLYRRLE